MDSGRKNNCRDEMPHHMLLLDKHCPSKFLPTQHLSPGWYIGPQSLASGFLHLYQILLLLSQQHCSFQPLKKCKKELVQLI